MWLPGSSPTRIVPSPGVIPRLLSAVTRSARSALISSATALPSSICALTQPSLPHPGRRLPTAPPARTRPEADARAEWVIAGSVRGSKPAVPGDPLAALSQAEVVDAFGV